jgi:hypothetical protein
MALLQALLQGLQRSAVSVGDRYGARAGRGLSFLFKLVIGSAFYLIFMVVAFPFWLLGWLYEQMAPVASTTSHRSELAGGEALSSDSQNGERVKMLVEIWKKIIDVQQHFNEIEIKIRDFAVTLALAVLGAAGFAAKEHVEVIWPVALGGVVGMFALWFMDRHWYHRLLYGSVIQGMKIEDELARLGYPEAALTKAIGTESAFHLLWSQGPKIRARQKLDFFYGLLVIGLLVLCAAFVASTHAKTTHRAVAPAAVQHPRVTSYGPGAGSAQQVPRQIIHSQHP